jgi:hypothetical protein
MIDVLPASGISLPCYLGQTPYAKSEDFIFPSFKELADAGTLEARKEQSKTSSVPTFVPTICTTFRHWLSRSGSNLNLRAGFLAQNLLQEHCFNLPLPTEGNDVPRSYSDGICAGRNRSGFSPSDDCGRQRAQPSLRFETLTIGVKHRRAFEGTLRLRTHLPLTQETAGSSPIAPATLIRVGMKTLHMHDGKRESRNI